MFYCLYGSLGIIKSTPLLCHSVWAHVFEIGLVCVQNEAEGFRRITYYLDRPDVMAKYTVRVEANKEKYPILLSNGNLVEHGDLEDGRWGLLSSNRSSAFYAETEWIL